MLKPFLTVFVALFSHAPAYATAATEAPSAAEAINAAIDGCLEVAATGRLETRSPAVVYMMIPRSTASFKSINDAPDLVRRFISTSSGGMQPQFVYHFRADKGEVWVVARTWVDRCDIAVTGMDEQSVGVQATTFFKASAGWQPAIRREAVSSAPLSHYTFIKSMPLQTSPHYGFVASIKSVGTTAKTKDGVQLEINIAAGNVTNTAGSISVEAVRPAPKLGKP